MLGMYRFFFFALFAAFVAWGVMAVFGLAGQRRLFYEEGAEELSDFWMPRMCLEQGYIGHQVRYEGLVDCRSHKPIEVDERGVELSGWYTDGENRMFLTGWRDKVYPRFAILPFALFPATRLGGYLWSFIAGVLLLCSLCIPVRSWAPSLLAMTMPFLFNLERGNPVWLSAACVGLFLAWWDDEKEWKRLLAAACLAVAGAMKIAPLALGAIYFSKWRWKPVLLCAGLTLALMLVPWFFGEEGVAAFPVMLRNAAEHNGYVLRVSDFGIVQLWRTVRFVQGLDVQSPWPGMMVVARLSQIFGLLCVFVGASRRNYILLVGGMLVAAGNMYYYAALYMLPVLVLDFNGKDKASGIELLLWFALLCPLQLIVFGRSANQVVGNLAVLALMTINLVTTARRKVTKPICRF